MKISRCVLFASLSLLLACASGGGTGPGPEEGRASGGGGSAPDFTLSTVDGEDFHLADHIGEEVLLLNFWATWCEPCRTEMPHLNRFQQEYGDQGFRIVAISMDGPESVSRVRSHIGRYDFSFTVLLDQESEVTQLYNPRRAAPFNALIDRSGSIVWSHEGYAPGDEIEVEQRIRTALAVTP
jgi:peroxiredoxin